MYALFLAVLGFTGSLIAVPDSQSLAAVLLFGVVLWCLQLCWEKLHTGHWMDVRVVSSNQ